MFHCHRWFQEGVDYIHTYTHDTLQTYMYICVYKYIHTYMYIYIYNIYIYTYIHTYIHICIHIYVYTYMYRQREGVSSSTAVGFARGVEWKGNNSHVSQQYVKPGSSTRDYYKWQFQPPVLETVPSRTMCLATMDWMHQSEWFFTLQAASVVSLSKSRQVTLLRKQWRWRPKRTSGACRLKPSTAGGAAENQRLRWPFNDRPLECAKLPMVLSGWPAGGENCVRITKLGVLSSVNAGLMSHG